MYCKSIDDYLVNIHAGRSIIPYMMKRLENKGITEMKDIIEYLKADKELVLFNDAWDDQMDDPIYDKDWDRKSEELEWRLKNKPDDFVSAEVFLKSLEADSKGWDNTEKQINESRRQRLERRWG